MTSKPIIDGTILRAVACGLTTLDSIPLFNNNNNNKEEEYQDNFSGITDADFSFNNINEASLSQLSSLSSTLHTLILDNNELNNISSLPKLPQLQRLWLNKNSLDNLDEVLNVLASQCPKLTFLSLLYNPCCPSELNGHLPMEYYRYRLYTKYMIPSLGRLDTDSFTELEAQEARKKGQFARLLKVKCNMTTTNNYNNNNNILHEGNEIEQKDLFSAFDQQRREGPSAVTYLLDHRYVYSGKGSEGNRFIQDDVL